MRILRLELEGFGPFRDRQTLDFARAAESGILLIAGRTGAGKSSLLDAVSFALYGAVPRYDGSVGRVRSDHCGPEQPTLVRLDFELHGERYRVERSPEWERPKKRGGGTTKQKQEARLWRWDEGATDWSGLASRPVDVATELGAVLGLTHEQFLQVVLLAQGGFQRFLQADDQARQATLRTLFRTQGFADIERVLADRRRELEQSVGQGEARVLGLLEQLEEAVGPWLDASRTQNDGREDQLESRRPAPSESEPEAGSLEFVSPASATALPMPRRRDLAAAAIERWAAEVEELRRAAREAASAAAAADERARDSRRTAAAQQRLSEARQRQERLAEQSRAVDADRARLALAERADRVAEAIARAARDTDRLSEAGVRETASREALARARDAARAVQPAAGPEPGAARRDPIAARPEPIAGESEQTSGAAEQPPADSEQAPAGFELERDEAAAALGMLAEAQRDESALAAVEARISDLVREIEAAQQMHERLRSRGGELPALVEQARARLEAAAGLAATLDDRAAAEARTQAVLTAAHEAETLGARLEAARRTSAERAAQAADAAAAVRDLLARRLSGMAGELADGLRDGEPCRVCGATEHPAPAAHEDPVGEDDIAADERRSTVAQGELEAARAAEREVETSLAAAASTADGHDIAAAERALHDAREAHRAARAASGSLDRLRAELQNLETESERSGSQETEARELVLRLETERSEAGERRTALLADLERARAGFDTIAERREAVTALHGALGEAISAAAALAAAREAARASTAERADALARHDFADAGAATAAVLAAERRTALSERLRAHDSETERVAGVLADPELQQLPEQPVPLAEHEQQHRDASEAARAAEAAAAAAESRLRERRAQLRRLDGEIADAAGGSEQLMRLRRLADAVQGKEPNTRRMRLEVFVLAARLEAIVDAANRRLGRMVGGRYRLQHDDGLRSRGRQSGLGLSVLDAYAGRERSTASLSGGETFLASLALALGLADVVTAEAGGIALDTLFVDEGFGSLDPDALDQALATLDGLREGGRTVALISHVAELKERLPAQLEVLVDERGISRLRGAGVDQKTENT